MRFARKPHLLTTPCGNRGKETIAPQGRRRSGMTDYLTV